MTGSLLNETLVGTFPPPVITQDGITIDRFLTYSVRYLWFSAKENAMAAKQQSART